MVSRRDLLIGSALAPALACRESAEGQRAAAPSPRFIGQSPERGHLLRSAELLDSPIDARERVAVAIVGGGVAGMSAAWRLRKAGLDDLALFELEPWIGGTAASGALPRSPHPMGAHYLPTPPRECVELHELLEDIGLVVGRSHDGSLEYASTAICPAPLERHHYANQWFPGLYPEHEQRPEEAEQLARFWETLAALDGRRDGAGRLLFRLPQRRSAATLAELDRMSMAAWLDEQGLDSWRLRWFVDYACRDDYGCAAAQTSAWAGLHHFLGRGLAQNREGQLLTFPGGNGELVAKIRDHARLGTAADGDGSLRRDHLVYAIDPERGELRVRDLVAGRSTLVTAERILWAAPRYLLPHVLPHARDPIATELAAGAMSYAPWLVANLELDAAPGGLGAPLCWDNVPIIEDPRARNLGYVVATHAEQRDRGSDPAAVITYYEPLVPEEDGPEAVARARARLLAGDARDWGEHVLAAMARMHPALREELRHLHLHRWGHAMIRPTPGLLFGGLLERARAPIARLRACGTDVGGLPLFEEAFYAAIEAADWAVAGLSGAERSSGSHSQARSKTLTETSSSRSR
ncbi:FAD-dependent oxidoreductase [Pseudenhygromyxa sp. WMMC2535]|uniref:FAD-dependent oxidoreductase n=1 Tax=Pseudenhygromyxa sp. WMMC2535 TaxID=2712867 RepID=UPI001553A762|nr:NAD(P)/FAD-dependent oxidoreductase [Pseudenhygromyxa sp. WMMC2535]NVB43368.1 FAD-dependent oxidoreductase [Pseudenhygromyxa sp. WMMC2535]